MKNAHFKTCNNLIFANIHRWYKIHTTKKVNEVALRSWNKSFTVEQGFSSPRKSWESGTMESHESHMAKAVRGRTTHSTCANSLPKDSRIKGKHTLHFSHFKVIAIAMQHFKEWRWIWIHVKHCTSRLLKLEEKTTKQNNPKTKPSRLLEALAACGNLSGMAFEVYCKEFCSDPNMGFLKTGHCWF